MFPLLATPMGAEEGPPSTSSRANVNEVEGNQNYDTANLIHVGDHVYGTLNYTDNDDVFRVNVTAGRVLNVTLYLLDYNPGTPWEYNLDFEILKPKPNPWILTAHWAQETQLDSHSLLVYETGEHFIWVYANGTASDHTLETDYILSVSEFNATSVGVGTHAGSIDMATDTFTDAWYKLTVAPDQAVNVTLTNPGTGDFDLYLYNRWPYMKKYTAGTATPYVVNGSWVRAQGNTESVEGLIGEGTYFVKVHGISGNGAFSLKVSELSYPDDGDSKFADATTIDHSQITLSSFHQSYDMFDWYKVSLDEGEHMNLTVDLMSMQGLAVFYIALYDQWGEPVPGASGNPIGVYDTNTGGGYDSSTNPIDNEASFVKVPFTDGVPSTSEWYVVVRPVFKLWETGENNFVPVDAMYRITWDLPNYGPDPVGTIPAIEMDEDEFYSLDLNDYFTDNEGNALVFSHSPSTIHNMTITYDQATGIVNLTPAADYNTGGDPINITFKATDGNADWGSKFSTQDTTFTINPINDAPRVKVAFVSYVNITEDKKGAPEPADLTKVFYDVDGDNLLFRATGNDNIPVVINQTTKMMSFGPVSGWYGKENITVTAEDPSGLTASSGFQVEIMHVNHAPTGVGGRTTYTHNITEDKDDMSLNVAKLFDDLDIGYANDELTYYIDYPLGYVPPFHMDVELDENGFLVIEPDINFSGQEEVPVFARDKAGAKVMVVVTIVVRNVNDPPEIRGVSPAVGAIQLEEGEKRKFEIMEVFDVDGDYIKYKWFVDGEHQLLIPALQSYFEFETDYTEAPGQFSAGNYTLEVWVSDETVNVTWKWEIEVLDKNRKPEGVKITAPVANQKFTKGSKVTFRAATATDPDKDTLTYTWTDAMGTEIGTGDSILYTPKKTGEQKITLTVSDGKEGGDTTASVIIKVTEDTGDGGLGGGLMLPILAVVIIVIIVIVLVIALKRRGGKPQPQTQKDVADSYEAQLWGAKKPDETPTPVGPAEEYQSTTEPAPAPEPGPEADEGSAVPTWQPGGGGQPQSDEAPTPGPPKPGPPQ